MKRTVIGILAHVDAGKTTLSEAMLYCSGSIRSLGRVDHGSAFLDNFSLERQRGITIFSKQAVMNLPELQITLLDTPGHADFSAEMERTLDVLDCAILVISASDGVQSHTHTVWQLLRRRHIPTLIFVNKTDLPDTDKSQILTQLRSELSESIADFCSEDSEAVALCDEILLDEYLQQGRLSQSALAAAVADCRLFACWFGSALHLLGIEEFLHGVQQLAPTADSGDEFGAKIYKISHDEQGTRLTHMKITGGTLRVRDTIRGSSWEEKITQLRIYSGAKYRPADAAVPGDVVAAAGLTQTRPGMGLGVEAQGSAPLLEPVMTYSIRLPDGYDVHRALSELRQIEEEEPELHIVRDNRLQKLHARLMGPVQIEVLQQQLLNRFGMDAHFESGQILYRETIANTVEGVGHFEPLRHYAEVHLLLEPAERGSGIHISSNCSEDQLNRNWQRLILTHLREKQHVGVLTGSPITDISITLVAGRAHLKHTEGGDFRQATYRALRQGLMQARSVLLEPLYAFRLRLPHENVGRAMTDLQQMGAQLEPPTVRDQYTLLVGEMPVAALGDYPAQVASYTRGTGRFSCQPKGYAPCADQDDVVSAFGYDPLADAENTPDSVFCTHDGAGIVPWQEVAQHMHLPAVLKQEKSEQEELSLLCERYRKMSATDKELIAIFERTYGPIHREHGTQMRSAPKSTQPEKPYRAAAQTTGPEYLLVDGYNIIFAWDELKEVAALDLDRARLRLIDILRSYQAFRGNPVIVVFDAYKVKNNPGSIEHLGGLDVVYTKEAQTADMYIERATHELGRKHRVRVATSDGLEQVIILGNGALRVSASGFYQEVEQVNRAIRSCLTDRT